MLCLYGYLSLEAGLCVVVEPNASKLVPGRHGSASDISREPSSASDITDPHKVMVAPRQFLPIDIGPTMKMLIITLTSIYADTYIHRVSNGAIAQLCVPPLVVGQLTCEITCQLALHTFPVLAVRMRTDSLFVK